MNCEALFNVTLKKLIKNWFEITNVPSDLNREIGLNCEAVFKIILEKLIKNWFEITNVPSDLNRESGLKTGLK